MQNKNVILLLHCYMFQMIVLQPNRHSPLHYPKEKNTAEEGAGGKKVRQHKHRIVGHKMFIDFASALHCSVGIWQLKASEFHQSGC